ncbi:hypothetical protein B0H34DRAFT_794019 [Crassisporium funariophilum]|nr:hypothetical protein B0H34DRAFT_794019 [Crassisporium funariophilum]
MSPTPALFYSSLPNIDDAHRAFVDRDILLKLVPIFANHKDFGVCLVHRHTVLEEGELMVTRGRVTQPERITDAYPHSWVRSGKPFEYNAVWTPDLPQTLLQDFQKIVAEESGGVNTVDGMSVLGICYAPQFEEAVRGDILVERTEERANIIDIVELTEELELKNTIPTSWLPAKATCCEVPVACRCRVVGGVHISECPQLDGLREVLILKENGMEVPRVDVNSNSATNLGFMN